MGEYGNRELLEIVGKAVVAAFEESAGLRSALKHESAARTDAESELIGLARAVDDFEGVIVQAVVDLDVSDGILHGQDIVYIGNGFERVQGVVTGALAENLAFGFVGGVAHL